MVLAGAASARFARGRPDGKVYRINTSHDRANFRTIENILIKDGPATPPAQTMCRRPLRPALGKGPQRSSAIE